MADAIPNPPEQWRPVVGYEGYYEVSNLGNVRSLDRVIVHRNGKRYSLRGRPMKATIFQGYPYLNLTKDGVSRTQFAHRLVAFAFLGSPEAGQEVCHIDGDKLNPCADNLYWGTRAENLADSLAHGTWNNQNLGKTHCIRGHEFTPENTRLTYRKRAGRTSDRPERSCIQCAADRAHAKWVAKKQTRLVG